MQGLSNPTLAFGVAMIRDWESAKPFLDHARFMRPFAFVGKNGETIDRRNLPADVLDQHGWVKRIPSNARHAVTVWHWSKKKPGAEQNKGDYVLTYDGEGELALKADAKVTSRTPGRIEFRNRTGAAIQLVILTTDPQGAGNYIRNIKLLRKEHEALDRAGALFNPDWLASIADARQIRFLNWMQANSSGQKRWANRPRLEDATWASHRGAPVEVMVRLANEIGADPWFTMPHQADEDYNRAFATYVRDHLDPRLKAHVEYSNELWNRGFGQTKDLIAAAKRTSGATHNKLVAQRSFEIMEIWRDVFGADADRRLVRVLGSWQASPDWTKKLLSHRIRPKAGGKRRRAAEGFDALAVSLYFGGGKTMAPRMLDVWRQGGDPNLKMKAVLENPKLPGSPAKMAQRLRQHAELAERHGLALLSYEGGQHVHTKKVLQIGGWEFNGAIERFVYSDEMASIYQDVWRAWREVGDGPFMQFVAVQRSSKSGSWGLQRYPGEATPTWRILSQLNARTPAWWGDGGGAQYQQGHLNGAGGTTGTAEEDYLIGGPEDDIFHPSTGSDGVFGGAGRDIVVLTGPREAYAISQTEGGVILTRGAETKTLTDVEVLRFADGAMVEIGG